MFLLVSNINISLFRMRKIINESLVNCHYRYYIKRIDTVSKRGSMLAEMIKNKDKRKNWHFSIISNKPKANMFEKIHKPYRRRAVLNTLFIRNITDVISVGEIVPEISNYGLEITGVQISPCYKMLNVFWQVPVSRYDDCEDISKLLNIAAPRIRAELISRNVLGHVPFIFFLRDCTNARVSAFEQAMQKLEAEPKSESSIIADDSFVEDILLFRDSKVPKSVTKIPEPVKEETKQEDLTIPEKPIDMKCNVFGLDHNEIMQKVVALKKKKRSPLLKTAVISPESMANKDEDEDDLFSKIPGVCFKRESPTKDNKNRKAILKMFHIERKMLMEKNKNMNYAGNDECDEDISEDGIDIESSPFDEDFIEDEYVEK